MAQVKRIFVEKRPGFDIEAGSVLADLRENLGISELTAVRVLNRYDVSGLSDEDFERAKGTIFSEPNADEVYDEEFTMEEGDRAFASEYLPGQFDQRADSAAQCVQLLTCGERPEVRTARVYILSGGISDEQLNRIRNYMINPVESRQASMDKPETLAADYPVPADVAIIRGFNRWSESRLREYYDGMGFAMSFEDLSFCREYFRDTEHRNPTVTELRVIDTYWSDHCRHYLPHPD